MDKFWLVWRKGGRKANFQHGTLESATTEAKRLSEAHPHGTYFVLEVIDKIGPIDPLPRDPPPKEKAPLTLREIRKKKS